jgi:Chaperone of endosialidase
MSQDNDANTNKPTSSDYYFGGVKEFNLEQIESEVLNESVYLDVFAGSDMRLKTDVKDLGSTLLALTSLDTILYKWNDDIESPLKTGEGVQVGVVAQQVAEVFPELVKKEESTGHLMVNYPKLTTHLLAAIKELHANAQKQDQRINELEKKLSALTHN